MSVAEQILVRETEAFLRGFESVIREAMEEVEALDPAFSNRSTGARSRKLENPR